MKFERFIHGICSKFRISKFISERKQCNVVSNFQISRLKLPHLIVKLPLAFLFASADIVNRDGFVPLLTGVRRLWGDVHAESESWRRRRRFGVTELSSSAKNISSLKFQLRSIFSKWKEGCVSSIRRGNWFSTYETWKMSPTIPKMCFKTLSRQSIFLPN